MKYPILFVAFLLNSHIKSTLQQIVCTTSLPCQNGNLFNTATCQCDCHSNYYGQLCENLDCTRPEGLSCPVFNKFSCSLSIVRAHCPIKCGLCANLTTSTTLEATTSTAITASITSNSVTTSITSSAKTTDSPTTQPCGPDSDFCQLLGTDPCDSEDYKLDCPITCGEC